jgi:hypothetical protein
MIERRDQADRLRNMTGSGKRMQREDEILASWVENENSRPPKKLRTDAISYIYVWLLIVLLVAGAIFSVYHFSKYQDKLQAVNTLSAAQDKEIKNLKDMTEQLNIQISKENLQNKLQNNELLNQVRELNATNIELKERFDDLINNREALTVSVASKDQIIQSLSDEKKILENKMNHDLKELESKILVLNDKIEHQSNAVFSKDSVYGQAYLDGQILLVNSDFNFVVLNLGSNHGLGNHSRLDVVRNGAVIAELEVAQLRLNTSACNIMTANYDLSIGDKVKIK